MKIYIHALYAVSMLCISFLNAEYHYEKLTYDNHVIHVVTLSPQEYKVQFVKAHDSVFGRETVAQMAEQSGATVAINGGFFEVGNNQDGMPSGTHIVDGTIFGLTLAEHDALFCNENGELSIQRYHPIIVAMIGKSSVAIDSVNRYVQDSETIVYTSGWGKRTLTSHANRIEVVFDRKIEIPVVYYHGNAPIPEGGYVVSFSSDKALDFQALRLYMTQSSHPDTISAVKGIPMLVQNGKILDRVITNKALGHTLRYSRTAVGIKKDGTMIIVVVEPFSLLDPKGMTLSDLKNILMDKGKEFAQAVNKTIWEFTLFDLKDILKKEYTRSGKEIVGLTMVELAQLMLKLGADTAINLGGGATTALWLQGQDTFNEKAEKTIVSDAIVFITR